MRNTRRHIAFFMLLVVSGSVIAQIQLDIVSVPGVSWIGSDRFPLRDHGVMVTEAVYQNETETNATASVWFNGASVRCLMNRSHLTAKEGFFVERLLGRK